MRAFEELKPLEAPLELQRHVRRQLALFSAPDILRRLVEEEVADPEKSVARRYAGRLDRKPAPDALENAVESLVEADGVPNPSAGDGSELQGADGPGSVFVLTAGSALAFLLLAVVWSLPHWRSPLLAPDGTSAPVTAHVQAEREALKKAGYSFDIVRGASVEDLDPQSAALVDSALGGLLGGVVH